VADDNELVINLKANLEGLQKGLTESSRSRTRAAPTARVSASASSPNITGSTHRLNSVIASDGSSLAISADTLCLHGDTPRAVEFARAIRSAFQTRGILVTAHPVPRE